MGPSYQDALKNIFKNKSQLPIAIGDGTELSNISFKMRELTFI